MIRSWRDPCLWLAAPRRAAESRERAILLLCALVVDYTERLALARLLRVQSRFPDNRQAS